MNIKINKDEAIQLYEHAEAEYVFGSHLYGTNTEKSDKDVLILIDRWYNDELDSYYPNNHMFQWDSDTTNTQYLFATNEQFVRNLVNGDSTCFADIVLFHDDMCQYTNSPSTDKMAICRTYKIIKAYLGLVKRDIKEMTKHSNKIGHIERGLYMARKLLDNQIPTTDSIRKVVLNGRENPARRTDYLQLEHDYRFRLNKLYNDGDIPTYSLAPLYYSLGGREDPLLEKLIKANNIREFKYG